MQQECREIICRGCGSEFEFSEQASSLLAKLSPRIDGVVYDLPPPTLCPYCRRQRRQMFRNERNLYKRTCGLSGAPIISSFAPEAPYTVFSVAAFLSDAWDPMEYGKAFDFSRPFFDQFHELYRSVPHPALCVSPDAVEQNCPYVNFAGFNRNCHMIFDSDYCEESLYSNVMKQVKYCADCSYVEGSELCFECIDCKQCYDLSYGQDCTNCTSSAFLKNCIGCSDCLFCCNLTRKKYHIENKPYSPQEYRKKLAEFGLTDRERVAEHRRRFSEFTASFPHKSSAMLRTENCTGCYLHSSKNCLDCYNIDDGEDLMFCDALFHGARDCMDVSSFGEQISQIYESATIGVNSFQVQFGLINVACRETTYCVNLRDCSELFGCIGLRRKSHCILNKQYTKDEYLQLVPKIIAHMRSTGEWGEFFPARLSPFAYNETMAQIYDPLDEHSAAALGLPWRQKDPRQYQPQTCIVPQDISAVDDSILGQLLACHSCGKNYKVLQRELDFYRKQRLPIPTACPDCRHLARMARRNPLTLFDRVCAQCDTALKSSYAPSRPEPVYCENCYQHAID